MRRITTIIIMTVVAIVGVVLLKYNSGTASIIWNLSNKGAWLLPLVLISALLDSVHPCSFSILLITIAFLFGMQMTRKKILLIGGTYIAGIFIAYLLIGLSILKVLHLFNTPHFMGKLGAVILITFGIVNIINEFFPSASRRLHIPRLKIPSVSHETMGRLVEKASLLAAFGLGLLRDQATYFVGFSYLVLFNIILAIPLVAVLFVAADKKVVDTVQEWKRTNMKGVRLWAGVAMIILGILIFFT